MRLDKRKRNEWEILTCLTLSLMISGNNDRELFTFRSVLFLSFFSYTNSLQFLNYFTRASLCSSWENCEKCEVSERFSEGYWRMLNNDHYASFVFQIDASRPPRTSKTVCERMSEVKVRFIAAKRHRRSPRCGKVGSSPPRSASYWVLVDALIYTADPADGLASLVTPIIKMKAPWKGDDVSRRARGDKARKRWDRLDRFDGGRETATGNSNIRGWERLGELAAIPTFTGCLKSRLLSGGLRSHETMPSPRKDYYH